MVAVGKPGIQNKSLWYTQKPSQVLLSLSLTLSSTLPDVSYLADVYLISRN